ncbi:hypothetical protein AVEN_266566-1 [Araneus ventricosus]|uniref:Secreted protein n=1 Tax=Araneus ventricosus TaxID=182803 RepID=A0A4Y2UGV0_ARAVE|nr:hypothetical protein AVEN_266566-1 [Araneus ventricosus]
MFILPALLYLKVLPLFGQCLYHFIVPNKYRPPHAGGAALSNWPSHGFHPSWVGRTSVGIFAPHQREDVWRPTYDVAGPIHNEFLVESSFEPGTFRLRN